MKRIIALMLCILTALLLTSCKEKDGSGYTFKYHIEYNPRSLDPQTAVDYSSVFLISNIYEGLLVEKSDGTLDLGVAESYTVSDNGLKYVFKLKEDMYWEDYKDFHENVTAYDFVFAFQRLFNPDTQAPLAQNFYAIKNAMQIHKQNADASSLGVYATGKYELIFELSEPDPQFPLLLTTSPAMPCNEKFFYKTEGRYGLSAKTTASNGPFYVNSWDYDKYSENNNIILRKNRSYNGEIILDDYSQVSTPTNITSQELTSETTSSTTKVYPFGLSFFIGEIENNYKDFTEGTTDTYLASGAVAKQLIKAEFPYTEYVNSTWGITLNTNKKPFNNENLRLALVYSINRRTYRDKLDGFVMSESIVPHQVTLDDINYRKHAGNRIAPDYDVDLAKQYYETAMTSLTQADLSDIVLLVPDDNSIVNIMSSVLQEWQKNFGFYCKLEVLSEQKMNDRMASGDFTFALNRITADFNSPASYLGSFSSSAINNVSGYKSEAFDTALKNALNAKSLTLSADAYKNAESILLSSGVFMPLFFQNEYFFTSKDSYDIEYNPFSRVIIYKNAKKS